MTDNGGSSSDLSAIDFRCIHSLANVVRMEIERMIVEGEFAPNERINQNLLAQIYLSLARELHIQHYRALSSGDVLHVSNAEHRAVVDAVAARDPASRQVALKS